MKTYEMVALAQEDGKTYKTASMYYNKQKGFHGQDGSDWEARAFDMHNGLQEFVLTDGWIEVKVKKVTMAEVEEKFGCKIEIIK